jgi:hypothetical protein
MSLELFCDIQVSSFPSFVSSGYLMQMMLQLNHTDRKNGSMGLELSLLEGDFDSILSWPFTHKFELMIINQRPEDAFTERPSNVVSSVSSSPGLHPSGSLESSSSSSVQSNAGDIIVAIDPSSPSVSCDPRSFTKPIERNPACGRNNVISLARVSRSTGFVRLGSLLVKVRIYLTQL